MAIRLRGVAKGYGGRSVLQDVSFEVRPGEIVALLGPNGAGKTTTAEIVEGYRRADAGSVEVLGRDPWRAGRAHRARVGLMLQAGGIDPRMRPAETLALYARFFGAPDDPGGLLREHGLEAVAATPYRRLSGGERQRLGLALALVGRPEVLVLDEPTSGMDPEAKAATRARIGRLRDAGAAVLLTTHELADVERLADRVVVLAGGRMVATGTVAEVLGGASGALRLRLDRELDTGARRGLEGAVGVGTLVGDGGAGRYRLEGAAVTPARVAAVAAWCAANDVTILELRTTGGSLEERYLELVGAATAGDGPDRA